MTVEGNVSKGDCYNWPEKSYMNIGFILYEGGSYRLYPKWNDQLDTEFSLEFLVWWFW